MEKVGDFRHQHPLKQAIQTAQQMCVSENVMAKKRMLDLNNM